MTDSARGMLAFEARLWTAGYQVVAGIDEVGRGALAGPLVAAAVVLPPGLGDLRDEQAFWGLVRDSKTLTAAQRSKLAVAIRRESIAVGVGTIMVAELDAIGLAAANRLAMEYAVAALAVVPDALLIDAITIDSGIFQLGVIDGDALCLSIAAASIVAKVHRDLIMASLDSPDSRYGFARHKGYGVPSHLKAIADHGPCPHHRTTFAPVRRVIQARNDG